MKIPNIFIPENKNLDKKLQDLLQDKEYSKTKHVSDIFSLACIPKKIHDYALRTYFEMIDKKYWKWHFGNQIPKYLAESGQMTYQLPLSTFFTSIYILEFKSGADLNELNRRINLKKEINAMETIKIMSLKKDNYLVVIKGNMLDNSDSLDVFGNWYLNNFRLRVL